LACVHGHVPGRCGDGWRSNENAPPKGSTFTIRLPKIVDAPAVASAHTGEAALKPH
jgi:hypothetical protein